MANFEIITAYKQLSPSERVFVDGFVDDLETQSNDTGFTFAQILCDLPVVEEHEPFLSLALVRAAISERVKDLTEERELSVHKTLKELRGMAYSNIGNYFKVDENGLPELTFETCTPDQIGAVKSIDIEMLRGGSRKIKIQLHDKVAALKMLMQFQDLLDGEEWNRSVKSQKETVAIENDATVESVAESYSRLINA